MNAPFRYRRILLGLLLPLGLCMTASISSPPAAAEEPRPLDFRVKTEVYIAGDRAPLAENLTLYTEHAVYDFTLNGGETAIFEPLLGRFVLLDPQRKLKTQLPLPTLGKFVADVKAEGLKSKDANLFDPQFQAAYAGIRRTIELTNPIMNYKAVCISAPKTHPNAAARFTQFTDWTARLNAITNGNLPFGRLALNRELQTRVLIPEEIELVRINPENSRQRVTLQSKQAFTWELTGQDQRRLDEVREQMSGFKMVEWSEYAKPRNKP